MTHGPDGNKGGRHLYREATAGGMQDEERAADKWEKAQGRARDEKKREERHPDRSAGSALGCRSRAAPLQPLTRLTAAGK